MSNLHAPIGSKLRRARAARVVPTGVPTGVLREVPTVVPRVVLQIVLAIVLVAGPAIATQDRQPRSIDPNLFAPSPSAAHAVARRADGPAASQRAETGIAREGWFCPIGTCGPPATGSSTRGAISFGLAALVAGGIARRRSGIAR